MDNATNFNFLHFLHLAHNDYEAYVKTGKKTYDRFRKDFINGHSKALPGEDENKHEEIIRSLEDLLKRPSLLKHYFDREELDEDDFKELEIAHNSTDPGTHPVELDHDSKSSDVAMPKNAVKIMHGKDLWEDFMVSMNEEQLEEVARWLSGKYKPNGSDNAEPLCKGVLRGEDIKQFFLGQKKLTICKDKNQYVLMVLDALQGAGLIGKDWRLFLDEKECLISGRDGKPITLKSIYRSLSGGKKMYGDLLTAYNTKAAEISDIQ